jgi:hypothetical protein
LEATIPRFELLDDGVPGDAGSTTTRSSDLSEASAAEVNKLFFRVELQNGRLIETGKKHPLRSTI